MPKRRRTSRGREDPEGALRDFYSYRERALRVATPTPPLERLRPGSWPGRTASRKEAARRWGREILSDLGFAACFLALATAGLSIANANPGPLVRRIEVLYESGAFAHNADYVGRQLRLAAEIAAKNRTDPHGEKENP